MVSVHLQSHLDCVDVDMFTSLGEFGRIDIGSVNWKLRMHVPSRVRRRVCRVDSNPIAF